MARAQLPTVPRYETGDIDPEWARGRPDLAAAAEQLRDTGVCLLGLGGGEVLSLCDQVNADVSGYFADPNVKRVQDAGVVSQAVRALASHPTLLDFLGHAYGRRPFPFQTLNFVRGSQQAAHMDSLFFDSEPARFMAGVWLALEDITEDSGPLFYYSGSHRLHASGWDALPDMPVGVAGMDVSVRHSQDLAALLAEHGLEKVTLTPKKGQAVVWTANVAHGGSPVLNRASTRQSLVIHYYFERCVYTTPMRRLTREPVVRVPLDIRTHRPQWPMRGRMPVLTPPRTLYGLAKRLLSRRPSVLS